MYIPLGTARRPDCTGYQTPAPCTPQGHTRRGSGQARTPSGTGSRARSDRRSKPCAHARARSARCALPAFRRPQKCPPCGWACAPPRSAAHPPVPAGCGSPARRPAFPSAYRSVRAAGTAPPRRPPPQATTRRPLLRADGSACTPQRPGGVLHTPPATDTADWAPAALP